MAVRNYCIRDVRDHRECGGYASHQEGVENRISRRTHYRYTKIMDAKEPLSEPKFFFNNSKAESFIIRVHGSKIYVLEFRAFTRPDDLKKHDVLGVTGLIKANEGFQLTHSTVEEMVLQNWRIKRKWSIPFEETLMGKFNLMFTYFSESLRYMTRIYFSREGEMYNGAIRVFRLDWIHGATLVNDLGEFQTPVDKMGPFLMNDESLTCTFGEETTVYDLDPMREEYWKNIKERLENPNKSIAAGCGLF